MGRCGWPQFPPTSPCFCRWDVPMALKLLWKSARTQDLLGKFAAVLTDRANCAQLVTLLDCLHLTSKRPSGWEPGSYTALLAALTSKRHHLSVMLVLQVLTPVDSALPLLVLPRTDRYPCCLFRVGWPWRGGLIWLVGVTCEWEMGPICPLSLLLRCRVVLKCLASAYRAVCDLAIKSLSLSIVFGAAAESPKVLTAKMQDFSCTKKSQDQNV